MQSIFFGMVQWSKECSNECFLAMKMNLQFWNDYVVELVEYSSWNYPLYIDIKQG